MFDTSEQTKGITTLCVQELIGIRLGIVQTCTLTGSIETFTYFGINYCMVNHGKKRQDEAIHFCKKLNARLPLPKSKGEVDKYLKITGSDFWIDLTDSTKSGNKETWKDIGENPIGNRYVNLRVITFNCCPFLCFTTDPD